MNYSPAYWHLVAAGKAPASNQVKRFHCWRCSGQAGFSEEEYSLLRESLVNSKGLVEVEKQAFAAAEGFQDDGTGNFTVRAKPDRELAIHMLFGTAIHQP